MAADNSPTDSPDAHSLPFQELVEHSRIIAESASDAVITINENSTILFVNRAAVKIFGYSTEEMLGSPLPMLMPEYLRRLHRAGLKLYVETGQKHISWEAIELPGLHKSGREISLELSFGEFQKDGHRFFTGIARDITKRKQDEARLSVQHSVTAILANADSLEDATPKLLETICTLGWQVAALWTVDSEQNELHCVANWIYQPSDNIEEFERVSCQSAFAPGEGFPGTIWAKKEPIWVTNYSESVFPRASIAARANLYTGFGFPIMLREEVLGVIELFSEHIKEQDPATLETVVAIGSQIGQFIERRKGDAERVSALDRAQEARIEAEMLAKRLAAVQRITDATLVHLSVDELLSESLSRIREVLNVDTVAILLLRSEGDELVAWAAQGLEEEVKLNVRIPKGKGFAGRVVQEGKPIIIHDISQADIYNPLLREKGIKSLLGVPLFVGGKPTGVLHVGKLDNAHFTQEDVTLLELAGERLALAIEKARLYQVQENARAQAESANRAKDEFLTILSHELRTPLTPIIGWIHMMQNDFMPEAQFAQALSVINRNSYSLKRLINDLLDMSAILSGKMRIEETDVSLAGVLEESVETMRSYARDSKVQLRLKISHEAASLMIKGDRSRLNQTFCNVLQNAIKFSPAGATVKISCQAGDSEATIRIQDQGQGISANFLPNVFERFRQEDASRTRAYGGLGLGLALVKSFVEAHGGKVEATSEGQGKGSVFTIRLPAETGQRSQTKKIELQPDTEPKKAPTRILIVEDQPDTLEMLVTNFQSRGYETFQCRSAKEALEIAGRDRFDIVISDIAMPVMDGLQLISDLRMRSGLENIPAIALTGYASQKDVDAAIAAGFDVHLSKPIDPNELAEAVDSLIASRSKQKS